MKKTIQQKATEIQVLCFVVNLFLIQPIEGNDCSLVDGPKFQMHLFGYSMVKCKV